VCDLVDAFGLEKYWTAVRQSARRIGAVAVAFAVLVACIECRSSCAQQLATSAIVQNNFTGISQIGSNLGDVTEMTFGPDGRLYVATLTHGIQRFDYSTNGSLMNGTTVWSRPGSPCTTGSQCNGSIGIAFHQDAALGTVMYIAPAVSGNFDVSVNMTQSIVRLTDSNGDGTWGGAGEINQAIVNNLQVTDLHQVNQLLIKNNTLYAGIGSRTRTGGNVSELSGAANPNDGEFAYTGAINWIQDLTKLDSNTTTANIAGFNITQPQTDTQPFTSTDPGKLTVFATGFRNPYGLAMDATGQLWASMNQNENPLKPDELHRVNFKNDYKFSKKNEVSGDWKTNAAAIAAGYFQTFKDPVALLGNDASADGLDFTYRNKAFAGHPFVVRFAAGNDLLAVDPTTGALTQIATGLGQPLDVLTDPVGNLLVGTYGSGGRIYRLTLVDNSGDYNGDGIVDMADYVVWREELGSSGSGLAADGDGNGFVNQLDYDFWRARYGKLNSAGAGAGVVAVPEPRAALMLGSLFFVRVFVRRPHRKSFLRLKSYSQAIRPSLLGNTRRIGESNPCAA
jgi:glucose/arabinose dehydrogenase